VEAFYILNAASTARLDWLPVLSSSLVLDIIFFRRIDSHSLLPHDDWLLSIVR
jgi:hypothetical protein